MLSDTKITTIRLGTPSLPPQLESRIPCVQQFLRKPWSEDSSLLPLGLAEDPDARRHSIHTLGQELRLPTVTYRQC